MGRQYPRLDECGLDSEGILSDHEVDLHAAESLPVLGGQLFWLGQFTVGGQSRMYRVHLNRDLSALQVIQLEAALRDIFYAALSGGIDLHS